MATRHQPNPFRELWTAVVILVQFAGVLLMWVVIAAIALAVLGKLI